MERPRRPKKSEVCRICPIFSAVTSRGQDFTASDFTPSPPKHQEKKDEKRFPRDLFRSTAKAVARHQKPSASYERVDAALRLARAAISRSGIALRPAARRVGASDTGSA